MKAKLARLLAAIVIISMAAPMFGMAPVLATAEAPPTFEQVEVESVVELDKEDIYIVLLEDAPLATYAGGVSGLTATSPTTTSANKLDASSPTSVAYLSYLAAKQAEFIANAEKMLDRSVDVVYQYAAALNGMAARVSAAEAKKLATLPGVASVERDFNRQIDTDAGPGWMGVYSVWDGTATGDAGTQGEGMLIGVIDTGINMDHPSFAEIGPSDGYIHTNPLGDGVFLGLCATEPTTYTCNNKLIGAYDYVDVRGYESDGPEDSNGHGSHTSSTAAGNTLEDAVIDLDGYVVTRTISGMAPHANIIMYDACDSTGCPNSATNAAINQAVLDGVDVINYSIGGGAADPWQDSNSQAYLAARTAGVFVATSAGNDGSAPGTVGSPANAPWLLSVGNASHNRTFMNTVSFNGGGGALADMSGRSVGNAYGPAPIVHAKNYTSTVTANDALCGDPFPAGTWSGEIVVCDRGGGIALVDKAASVAAGGAGGVIIANAAANGEQVYATPLGLPSSHISYTDAEALRAWLDAGTGHTATLSRAEVVIDDTFGDRMSPSSSRGPNLPVLDVIKPSVIAPGTDIIAAYHNGPEYAMIGGTSMASPHTAGVALLVRSVHPDWSPAQVQSAMESTALYAPIYKEDWVTEADPFDYGAGRPYAQYAVQAGFVLDETESNYTDADPLAGGDPSTLNLTVLGQDQCLVNCTWTREIESTMGEAVTWTVSTTDAAITVEPSSFTLPAGGTQVVTVTADVTGMPYDEWFFGRVEFTPDTTDTVPAHFTVAALPSAGVLPESVVIETRRDVGAKVLAGLEVAESPELTVEAFGLVAPTMSNFVVEQHPDTTVDFPDIFFGFDEVATISVTVPAGAKRLVAEIFDTTSDDLDMLVLPDTDGDGTPELSDLTGEECQSAAGGPWESCDILDPSAGTWFVMILNYTEIQTGGDPVTLGTAVVTDIDEGNMTVTHPASVPAATPFDITLAWDEAMMEGDMLYGGFSVGTTAATPGDIKSIVPVKIIRLEDDVVKDATVLKVGDDITITYQLTVQPNASNEDYTLTLTDTIPAGLTYVPGSADASRGSVNVVGNELTWAGVMQVSTPQYVVTDNSTDPNCDTPIGGGYLDAYSEYGYTTLAGLEGDTISWQFGSLGTNTEFYGTAIAEKPRFTDDGFVLFPDEDTGAEPWTNQDLPDPTVPNGLAAPYWRDMEIIYTPAPTNTGVTGVNYGVAWVVEFDDIQVYDDPSQTLDFEVWAWTEADPSLGTPDIVYAYDNVNIADTVGTVGIENADGTVATQYAYDDFTPTDGLIVCLDWYVPGIPVIITYQVTVDNPTEGAEYTNVVEHDTDALGTVVEMTSRTVAVGYDPTITKTVDPESISAYGDMVTYTISLGNENTDAISGVTMTDTLPPMLTFEGWVEQPAGATFTAPDMIEWAGTIPAKGTVDFVFTASTPEDTHSILIDIVNTAYMEYPGGSDSDSVSFSLIKKIYLPLVMRAYAP
jgi:uncharacterized repeat protein (TIGR01451 family)